MVKKYAVFITGALVATNILSFTAWSSARADNASSEVTKRRYEEFPLLARRILVDQPNDVIINFSPLRQALNQYFEQNITSEHSFYFEYLPTGTSIRMNSTTELVGASLLKLPAVMDLYRAEELGRLDINDTVTIKQEWLNSDSGNLYQKGAGIQITLCEAAELALKQSDNTAVNAIIFTAHPTLKPHERSIVELDVNEGSALLPDSKIGAQSYSSLIKCLYFSCFLKPENSNQIIQLLVDSDDADRIAAGIPSEVPVAHKFGTFGNETQSDCGIVYAEARPYALCMLIDADNETANRHIQAVSSPIYQYISDH